MKLSSWVCSSATVLTRGALLSALLRVWWKGSTLHVHVPDVLPGSEW
jgi:hypothetical protein